MSIQTHNYPLSQMLSIAQRISTILKGWTEERVEQWATTYPDSVNMILDSYAYGLLTHPEYQNATPEDQQVAKDVFRDDLEVIGKYADSQQLGGYLTELSMQGTIEFSSLLVECLGDTGQVEVGPDVIGSALRGIFYTTFHFGGEEEDAAEQIREIMEDLADHPHMDISQLVTMWEVADIMQLAAMEGHLEIVDAIVDNLSDDAQVEVGPYIFGETIAAISEIAGRDPGNQELFDEASALIRKIMEDLADNEYVDIAQLVDTQLVVEALFSEHFGRLDVIEAVTDNWSDMMQEQLAPYLGTLISKIAASGNYAPFGKEGEYAEAATALIREIVEDLADHPHLSIEQLIDPNELGGIMWSAAYNGDLEVLSVVSENLTDMAQYEIGSQTWAYVLDAIYQVAPMTHVYYQPTLEECAVAFREVFENLADHPHVGIEQLVDMHTLKYTLEQAAMNGHLEFVDAITDNLNDMAQYEIGPQTFAYVIDGLAYAGQFNPEVSQEAAAAQIREIMEDLADHPHVGIEQLVDMHTLSYVLQNAGMNGDIELIDAITDNLNDMAQFQIGPQTFAYVIDGLAYAGQFNPEVSQEAAAAQIREIMEDLADHPHVGIEQLVDMQTLSYTLQNAGMNGDIELIDAITDNLNDMAQYEIGPQTFAYVIDGLAYAGQFNPEVSQEAAAAQIREIMEDLADHPHVGIEQLVDMQTLSYTLQNASMNGDFGLVDAITDNLSDDAQAQIGPETFGTVLRGIFYSTFHFDGEEEPAADQIREIMEGLADHEFMSISQLVSDWELKDIAELAIMEDHFEIADAIIDNLDAQTLATLDADILAQNNVSVGTEGNDYVYDFAGEFEAIFGHDGTDFVIGGEGDTALFGGDGNDYVYDFGAVGDDVISGGDGSDYLYGGGGADTFVFREGETGVDNIYFFNAAEGDKLDIGDYLEQYDELQHAIDDFVILSDDGRNTTVSVDVDGQGGEPAQEVAVLLYTTGLEVEDVIDITTTEVV